MKLQHRYYVELRNVNGGVNDFETTGYLGIDGSFTVEADWDFEPGTVLSPRELFHEQCVLVVSYDRNGKLRSVEERKHIAALAERYGYRIRRGARANLKPEDILRLRALNNLCKHENVGGNTAGNKKFRPYRCLDCDEAFEEFQVVFAEGKLRLSSRGHRWRSPNMTAAAPANDTNRGRA